MKNMFSVGSLVIIPFNRYHNFEKHGLVVAKAIINQSTKYDNLFCNFEMMNLLMKYRGKWVYAVLGSKFRLCPISKNTTSIGIFIEDELLPFYKRNKSL